MDTKSEKDLVILNDLPALPRVEEPTVASDAALRPVDGGFGAWSFVSNVGTSGVQDLIWTV
jgi:hypothetical protein